PKRHVSLQIHCNLQRCLLRPHGSWSFASARNMLRPIGRQRFPLFLYVRIQAEVAELRQWKIECDHIVGIARNQTTKVTPPAFPLWCPSTTVRLGTIV